MDRGDDVCTEFIYWLSLAGLVISHVIHLAAVNSQVVGLRANDLYQLDTNYSHSHHTSHTSHQSNTEKFTKFRLD